MKLSFVVLNKRERFLIVILLCHIGFVLWENSCYATAKFDRKEKQVSAYKSIDGAMQDVNLWKSKGYKAHFEKVHIPGKGIWYRVFIVKNQKNPSRSRDTLKNKKRTQERVKPATKLPYSKAGEFRTSTTNNPDPGIPDQGVKASSIQSQTALKRSAIPDVANKKSERSADLKTNKGSAQINNKNAPFQSEYEKAKAEFDSGHYEKAAGMLSVIILRKQNDAAQQENSLRCLADCHYFLGEGGDRNFNSKAVDSYKNILRYYPDTRGGNDITNFRLANCLEHIGNYEEAYTAYENVVRKYPKSLHEQDALYKMGEILYLTKRFSHGIEKLRNYLAKYPSGSHASQSYFLIGYCFRQINQQTEGALWYRNALNKENDFERLPADVLYDLGTYLFFLQDYSNAANLFAMYLNLYPEGVSRKSALFHLGRSFYSLNRFSLALKLFSLLLESYPETGEANESILFMANIGVMDPTIDFNACMAGHDYFKNPVEAYDWMRKKYPGGRLEEWLLYQKGYALWKTGHCKESFDLYCHLLNRFSNGILQKESRRYLVLNAKRLIEESYGKGDDLVVADIYYKISNKIPLSPETCDMFFKAFISLWRMELTSDAATVGDSLKQNSQNASQRAILDLIMMEINYSRGGTEVTEEKWNFLLREFAKNKSEMANMARKNMADYLYKKGQYDKVIPLYEVLLKSEENSGLLAIQGNYAHALQNKNLCSSAINRYQVIVNKCKENPLKCEKGVITDAYAGLGDCYFETAEYKSDIAMYQQAFPQMQDKENQMWTLFRMGQSYNRINDTGMARKIFSELKEKSGDIFWPKVVDYWAADQAWSKNNVGYLKKN